MKAATEFKWKELKQDKATFTHRNMVNLFIVYELDTWSQDLNVLFTRKDCLFGTVKSTKNVDPDKYFYSKYRYWI